ncbi:HCP-like protein [Myriangium duriaei CBS 260.36]|uniref:HCP-like protein n=1 Tax=Myriangium duriaei CBS 260.36 TaxID=1168546 RepID=A0A9P4JAA5_9PEZI|nr:HCP-like protein [Myriangium duriaei CBS 260.36]
MASANPHFSATFIPGAYDDFYEPPLSPDLAAPAPQRIMPEMSDQISEGLHNMDLGNRQSIMQNNSPDPFPKLRNPPPNIPPSDDDLEATLENAKQAVLTSNDPDMQLAWAQDALHQIDINAEDRIRLQGMQMRAPATSSAEYQMRVDAMNIVSFLAEQHHPKAEFIKGMWWEFGKFGCRIDKKEAFRCYSRAADRSYTRAEYRIGMLYEASNDPIKALKHYHKGVAMGDAACLYRLGMMTLRGQHGQQQDFTRGVDLIKQSAAAADDNAAQGAYVYGMLLAGELEQISLPPGVLQLDERAARIEIEKAAYMKFTKAQLKMGQAYELGSLGCEFNAAYSIHYYALAARQGDAEAEMGISKWFLVGHEGVFAKNEELSYVYAQRSALSGFANAEFAMGYFNELGIHVPKNVDIALEWYKKAAANGNADAQGRIDGISHKQVLNRQDHENITLNRIKSQYGSKRGQRPQRFSNNSLPIIGDGQQSQRRSASSQFPPRSSSAAPYPTNDGPPVLPPLGDRPPSVTPYPIGHDGMPSEVVPQTAPPSSNRTSSGFGLAPSPQRPGSSMTVPDPRQRYPSSTGLSPRPATSVDGYGRDQNQRIVSSPAGTPGMSGPPRPPKDPDYAPGPRYSSTPSNPQGRRPVPSQSRPNMDKPSTPSQATSPYPARMSSRPDLGKSGNVPEIRPPQPPAKSGSPDFSAAPKPGQTPTKPSKGPKTFEEMGVPAGKQDSECIMM